MKLSVGLVGLLLVGAAGCDQSNTTYDATYVVLTCPQFMYQWL